MKLQIFTALLLLGVAYASPLIDDYIAHLNVTREFFPDSLVKYKGKHDIVKIVVPLNAFNFGDDELNPDKILDTLNIFFAEADIDERGKRTYQGLYVLKDGKAKKILDNGRDAAASSDDSTTVYLAASDGLYTYKQEDQTAEKYGSITDSIIGIDQEAESDVLYILTEDNSVYRVTDNGNNKVKLEDIVNAQQILLDYKDNLYFYTPDKKVYVRTSEGIKSVKGLPENPSKITLVKPNFVAGNVIPLVVDDEVYIINNENAASEKYGIHFQPDALPTAFGMESARIQYHGFNKKIFEYNLQALDKSNTYTDKDYTILMTATQKRRSLKTNA